MSDINVGEPSPASTPSADDGTIEKDLGPGIGPSRSQSAPQMTHEEVTYVAKQSDEPSATVPSDDHGKLRVLVALVDEFSEWLASHAQGELTDSQRNELQRRLNAVVKLREPFEDLVRDLPSKVSRASCEEFADKFCVPYGAAIKRATDILNSPATASSFEAQTQTSSPADSAPSPLETTVDRELFSEFLHAIERCEKAREEVDKLYDEHFGTLMRLADSKYVRASKEIRERFFRL